MATLEKIRSKGTLLLIVVGLALFAFIIGDFLNSGSTFFGQSKMNVITVGDEVVKINQYQERIDELTQVYQIQYNQSQLSESMMEQIRQSVFDAIVREKLIEDAAEKVGITITSKELFNLVSGDNIHPIMQSLTMFVNPETGAFDRNNLLAFLNSLKVTPDMTEEQYQQVQQAKTFWLFWENLVKSSKLEEKYSTLVTNALNTNSLEAKFAFENKLTTVDAAYVVKPYTTIADSTITVSDKELEKEYSLKKERFKQEANRNIDYISFPIKPSQEDYAKIQDWISRLKGEFTHDADIVDLVNSNSDVSYPTYSTSEQQTDPDFKNFAFSGKKDSIHGPIFLNGSYKMARIMETGLMAPDSVNIKHILLFEKDEETTQKLADSIVDAVKGGANFSLLAEKYSRNPNTARNGGEVGWVQEGNVEKEMIKPVFYNTPDSIFAVKTNNGTQIILIKEKTQNVPKVKLAVLARAVNASTNTYSKIYNDAKEFVAKNNTVEKFEAAAKEQNYTLQPANSIGENAPRLTNNIPDSRKIVKWAFENNSKAVSDVFECGDEFIVAAVTAVNPKGYKPMNDVKDELKTSIILDKKAEIITTQFNDKLKQNNNIKSLANAVLLGVDTLRSINFSSTRTAIGFEPAIVAVAPYIDENTLSAPLKGKTGVYVISPYHITVSNATYNDEQEKSQMNSMYKYTVPQGIFDALKSKEEIVDKRSNFY